MSSADGSTRTAGASSSPLDALPDLPWRRGAIAGTVTWVVLFAAAYAVAAAIMGGVVGLHVPAFVFYGLHLVDVVPIAGQTTASGNVPLAWLGATARPLLTLPAVALFLAGALTARGATTPTDGVRRAATLTPAYVALSLVGALVLTGPFFGATYRPSLALALVAGAVWPLSFGTLGGAVAGALGGE